MRVIGCLPDSGAEWFCFNSSMVRQYQYRARSLLTSVWSHALGILSSKSVSDRKASPCLNLLRFVIPGHNINRLENIYFEGQDRKVTTFSSQ